MNTKMEVEAPVVHKKVLKPFCCSQQGCSRAFKEQKSLLEHLRMHRLNNHYICFESCCRKKFNSYSSLKKHERIHKGEKPYECNTCKQSFTQISNLRRHERVHRGEKPFDCTDCGKSFSTSSNLKQHLLVHQKKDNRSKINCKICGNSYYYKASLNKHMRVHRNQEASLSNSQVKQEEEEEEEEINQEVNKKIFMTSSNVVIPNIQSDAYNKETMKSLISFWNTNSREWFLANIKKDAPINVPQTILVGSQIFQGLDLLQTLPKIVKEEGCSAESIDSDDCKDTNDCLSDSSSKGEKNIPTLNEETISIQKHTSSAFKPYNASGISFNLLSNLGGFQMARRISPSNGLGHSIIVPKPIRPKPNSKS